MASTVLLFVVTLLVTLFLDVIHFAVDWLIAKFFVVPFIGAQICSTLNLVLGTHVFTLAMFPTAYATAAFVGRLLFKPSKKLDLEKEGSSCGKS